jgi:hypothetical protein
MERFVGCFSIELEVLDVGNFFLFCRYKFVGYQLLGAVLNRPPRVVVEA